MIRILRTAEPASDELREAVRWYEARRAGLGGEFFDAIAETFELIKARPEIGSPVSADRQTRRVLVPRFPYQVIYRLRPSEIVIVAIAHLKRCPGYWKTRNWFESAQRPRTDPRRRAGHANRLRRVQ